ncbi:glycosyltransferase family 39 protein, partial [Candidatus Sumerlaeota bacterium]|nr:glycosyltransferase family 39 protein [Candidatus Sumerlaeota bacterium]
GTGVTEKNRDAIYTSIMYEWPYGRQFLYQLNRGHLGAIFVWTRIPMILLSVLTGWLVYLWAKRLWGTGAGIFALGFLCFSPDLLGHAPLTTTDVCYTLFNTWALYQLYFYLADSAKGVAAAKQVVLLGMALAGGLLSKFSAPAIFGFFAVALAAFALRQPAPERMKFIASKSLGLAASCAAGAILTALVYWILFGHLFYLEGFQIVSKKLLFNPNVHFYLLGRASKRFYSYFVLAYLIKMTLPVLVLLGLFLFLAIRRGWFIRESPLAYLLLFSLFFLTLITLTYPEAGVRYMLPLWPVTFLFLGRLFSEFQKGGRWKRAALAALLGWHALAALLAFPDYISYMNEVTLAKGKGYFLADSNLDWGQDLPAIKRYGDRNGVTKFKALLFGMGDPEFYGLNLEPLEGRDIVSSPPGTEAAISVFQLQVMDPRVREALGLGWERRAILNDTIYIFRKR